MLDPKTLKLALKLLDGADGGEAKRTQQQQNLDPWEQPAQLAGPDNTMGLGL